MFKEQLPDPSLVIKTVKYRRMCRFFARESIELKDNEVIEVIDGKGSVVGYYQRFNPSGLYRVETAAPTWELLDDEDYFPKFSL